MPNLLEMRNELYNMQFVYFGHDEYDIYTGLAVGEILKEKTKQIGNSYFRTFQLIKPAAVIAVHEDISDIRTEQCIHDGLDFTRYPTAGSAIWLDAGILAYSITGKSKGNIGLTQVHKNYGGQIALALKDLGIKKIYLGEKFSITLSPSPEGVISGNSIELKNPLFYHGVLVLRKLDVDAINKYIILRKQPVDELNLIRQLPSFYSAVGKEISPSEISKRMVHRLSDGKYTPMSEEEHQEILEQAKILGEQKYRSREWVFKSTNRKNRNLGYCLIALTEEWKEKNFQEV